MPDSAICKVILVANCGSAQEDQDSWGVAHFLEHCCFQGTPLKNKHQISRDQALVGSFNASTNYFATTYHFDALNEDFEKGLMLLKEAVFDSNFPEQEFEKEKSVIIEEWRMYDNYPTEFFWNFVAKKCFGTTETHPIIGTEQSIRDMSPEKLHRYRNKWYGQQNMGLIIVGNLKFTHVMDAVNKILPQIPQVQKTGTCLNSLLNEEKRYAFETSRFEQAAFGHVQKWISLKENIEQKFVPTFFMYALNKYLYEHIRDDLGLCYGVSISGFSHYENNHAIISMLTSNEHLEKAEEELVKLFNKVKENGFPDELFEICKKQYIYSKIKGLQNVHGVANTVMAGIELSIDNAWFVEQHQKLMNINLIKECAENLKPSNLQEFAQKHLEDGIKFVMSSTK
jgi:predicted Zn-dependent peptidase